MDSSSSILCCSGTVWYSVAEMATAIFWARAAAGGLLEAREIASLCRTPVASKGLLSWCRTKAACIWLWDSRAGGELLDLTAAYAVSTLSQAHSSSWLTHSAQYHPLLPPAFPCTPYALESLLTTYQLVILGPTFTEAQCLMVLACLLAPRAPRLQRSAL